MWPPLFSGPKKQEGWQRVFGVFTPWHPPIGRRMVIYQRMITLTIFVLAVVTVVILWLAGPGIKSLKPLFQVVAKAVRERNGAWLITADHGNAELMKDPVTGGPHTAHTTNPVPMIYVAEDAPHYRLRHDGSLRDISPTLLGMLGITEPKEMTGADLRKVLKA